MFVKRLTTDQGLPLSKLWEQTGSHLNYKLIMCFAASGGIRGKILTIVRSRRGNCKTISDLSRFTFGQIVSVTIGPVGARGCPGGGRFADGDWVSVQPGSGSSVKAVNCGKWFQINVVNDGSNYVEIWHPWRFSNAYDDASDVAVEVTFRRNMFRFGGAVTQAEAFQYTTLAAS